MSPHSAFDQKKLLSPVFQSRKSTKSKGHSKSVTETPSNEYPATIHQDQSQVLKKQNPKHFQFFKDPKLFPRNG